MDHSHTRFFELKAAWPRLIHRLYTLGITKHSYSNVIAGLVEERMYPRQIPSIQEDMCHSLDGTHLWMMSNWSKGWAFVDEERNKAGFLFAARAGNVFHRIELTDNSQWDCLDCILKVFARRQVNAVKELLKQKTIRPYPRAVSDDLNNVSAIIGETLSSGSIVKCTLPVSGGLIMKKQQLNNVVTRLGVVSLVSDNSQLSIDAAKVKHVDVNRKRERLMSTFYNLEGIPQLIIEAA